MRTVMLSFFVVLISIQLRARESHGNCGALLAGFHVGDEIDTGAAGATG